MNSEPIKFTEVKDKRLLKATPMERKKLMFGDNSYNVYVGCVGLRDRSFITSQGGGGGGGGGGGFGGGYNFKTSTFLGGKFFSGKKHEGGQIL